MPRRQSLNGESKFSFDPCEPLDCPIPPALAPSTKEDALPLSGTPPTAKKYPAYTPFPHLTPLCSPPRRPSTHPSTPSRASPRR